MKAAVLHAQGELPRFEDFPEPIPTNENETVVRVKAASLKNLDRSLARGSHYDSHRSFPTVVGLDGVAVLEDGTRILTGARPPYGMMAEKALISKEWYVPVPDTIDDATAAALPNPGLSAWFSLTWRAQLQPGDTVLLLGATGVTGKMAIQLAKHLGAGRIVATGRNAAVLETLPELGADEVVSLNQSDEELKKSFLDEVRKFPVDVVLDYVWGRPAELLLDVLTGHDLTAEARRTRYVQVGEMAGPVISLRAATLRSSMIELYGQGGGSVPRDVMAKVPTETLPYLFDLVAQGKLHIDTEEVPLSDVTEAWQRRDSNGRRIVIVP